MKNIRGPLLWFLTQVSFVIPYLNIIIIISFVIISIKFILLFF